MISKFFIERPVLSNVIALLMILIGGVLGEKEIPGFERSRLYAPDFSTGFRKGTKD